MKLTSGGWARPGGVVMEAGFAAALGLHVGDRLRLAGIPFQVTGTAVTAAVPGYPEVCYLSCDFSLNGRAGGPGLVWLMTADAALAARTADQPVTYFLNLKLGNPAGATAFASRYADATANTPNPPYLISWQDISNEDAKTTGIVQLILFTGSGLLVLLALASVAVLVGGRIAGQSRRVAGALLGIPGGIGIYDAVKNAGSPVIPAAGWMAVMVLGTVAAAAVLTVIPARLGARQPVAEILQAETA